MKHVSNKHPEHEGFSIYVGETYVGFIRFAEKLSESDVEALRDQDFLCDTLKVAELRSFSDKPAVDTDILSAVRTLTGAQDQVQE